MKIKTANTILYCTRWEETVAFYQEALGLPVHFSNDWFVEFTLNDDARLSVANETRASIKSGGGKGITLSFNVDDVNALRLLFINGSIRPTPIKELWGSQVFYIHDPEGNRIEFWS